MRAVARHKGSIITEMPTKDTRVRWGLIATIVLAALLLRLPNIDTRSLWIDELYSEWFSSRPLAELWRDVPSYETHPPFYYAMLKAWRAAFGKSELGLRSLSLVASLLTVLALGVLPHLLKLGIATNWTSLSAAALLAVNYASIREAQNARPYALQTLFCTIAILSGAALISRLKSTSLGQSRSWIIPSTSLGLFTGVALWLHNTSFFFAVGLWSSMALSVMLLPKERRWQSLAIITGAGMLALVVWLPYMPTFLKQSRNFSHLAFWLNPKPADLYSAWMLVLGNKWLLALLAIAMVAWGLFWLSRIDRALATVFIGVLVVPLGLMLAVSFSIKPIYIQRLFVWMVPIALLAMTYGLSPLSHQGVRNSILVLVISIAAFCTLRDIDRPIDDWKLIVREIATHAEPGDVVIATPAEGSIALDYYVRQQPTFPPIVCIPGCYPQRGLKRRYGSNLGAPMIVAADGGTVDRTLSSYKRIWLVQVSVALYDPKSIVRSRVLKARHFVRYYGNSLARVDLFEEIHTPTEQINNGH